jgi:hypothetical protein
MLTPLLQSADRFRGPVALGFVGELGGVFVNVKFVELRIAQKKNFFALRGSNLLVFLRLWNIGCQFSIILFIKCFLINHTFNCKTDGRSRYESYVVNDCTSSSVK